MLCYDIELCGIIFGQYVIGKIDNIVPKNGYKVSVLFNKVCHHLTRLQKYAMKIAHARIGR